MPVAVIFPLVNPNEPEAMLAAVHVSEGQYVAAGNLLFTLETTKSTAEVAAEADGFVARLQADQGQIVNAGDIFCYLAETEDWQPPAVDTSPEKEPPPADAAAKASSPGSLPAGLRITQPALALAQQAGVDLSRLPAGPLVTEKMVRQLAGVAETTGPPALLIYGGGGHGKALIDLLRTLGAYHLAGIVDDGFTVGDTVMGLPVLGGREVLASLHAQGVRLAVNAVGGIGSVGARIKVFQALVQAGFTCPAVVHPTATVEPSASLSEGVQVFPHAYVGSESRIGFGAIVNTGAIVSHECVLGEYVNISPGAMLAGRVQVGAGALIGMGVTVNLQVQVGAGARVGNSATVKADVPPNGIVRAGAVYP